MFVYFSRFLTCFRKNCKNRYQSTSSQSLRRAITRFWRKMRKPFIADAAILLIVLAEVIFSTPVHKSMHVQLNSEYLRAMSAYKRLESRIPREDLRVITTIGILNGARHAEKQMERNLVSIVKDLLSGANELSDDELIAGVQSIEKQLARDHRALLILTSAMDLVTGAKDVYEFNLDMQQTLQKTRRTSEGEIDEVDLRQATKMHSKSDEAGSAAEQVAALRRHITQQVRALKTMVEEKVTKTLDYLITEAGEGSLLEQASKKVLRKRNVPYALEVPAEVRIINSILTEDFRNNLVDTPLEIQNNELIDDSLEDDFESHSEVNKSKIVIENRRKRRINQKQSSRTPTLTTTSATTTTIQTARSTKMLSSRAANPPTTTISPSPNTSTFISDVITDAAGPMLAKQEEPSLPLAPQVGEDEEFPDVPPPPPGGAGGGGLVGIITSLSGGEGGSDIGALIGALTGVISTLFGPGGLDIESLISTATSLISGLLAGNKNFGTVLGIYIGTAFDGLSGGGGAVNNGQFLGNILGTVYAQLSADPEDDDLRPNPLLFARNLINSFMEAKNRKESDEDERRSDTRHSHTDKGKGGAGGGSDSGGFIKHIASHLVGSLVNLLLNASLGASGGALHASASLFGSSSHKGSGGEGGGGGDH